MRPKEEITMRPSERIELAIYRYLKPRLNPRGPVFIGELMGQLGHDGLLIEGALVSMEDRSLVVMSKYDEGSQSRISYAQWNRPRNQFFFTGGNFEIELGPQGTRYFEILEEKAREESQEPLVFISCGQYHNHEKALGTALVAALEEVGYKGYFAENQNLLESLTRHIFGSLNKCAGFVGVMHYRGEFADPHGRKYIRASIWVEQEIAIAAFLTELLKKKIEVLIYAQRGITREGVRDQLKLTPIEFDTEDDVLAHFKESLKTGAFRIPTRK
jgi:hypothetical protein